MSAMKALAVATLALALAACAKSQAPASSTAPPTTSGAAPVASALAAKFTVADTAQAMAMLRQYHWQLAAARDKSGHTIGALFARPDKPLQLDFTAHAVTISHTCNRMQASYSTAGNRIRIGALAATLMACPDAKLQALDQATAQYLSGTFEFEVGKDTPPTLALTTATGDMLAFNGVPTADTRYGGSGTTMFLEVAPQTKPCNHPLMPNARCLEVRELHYGANGIKQGTPGEWHVLAQGIDGYTHQPGTRNVLRIKRYQIAHPPADASSVAYVLDMVVETELPTAR